MIDDTRLWRKEKQAGARALWATAMAFVPHWPCTMSTLLVSPTVRDVIAKATLEPNARVVPLNEATAPEDPTAAKPLPAPAFV